MNQKPWIAKTCFVSSIGGLLLGAALGMCSGCQSTKNLTYVYLYDSNATVRVDGGSNAKPIEVSELGKEATITPGM